MHRDKGKSATEGGEKEDGLVSRQWLQNPGYRRFGEEV